MTPLTLLCASGLAREVLAVVCLETPGRPVRLLDDDPSTWRSTVFGVPVEGSLDLAQETSGGELLICAGSATARRAIARRLSELGIGRERYGRIIHPLADVAPGCSVGRGSILLSQVVLTANVQIGDHVVVMPHVTLTHDDVVEDFATLCAGVTLGGGVHVESGAYLGMRSAVRERVAVGHDAVLGMGSVLLRDLPPRQTWAGVPARPLRSSMVVAN
jgi:sugar O-acyltransferase (sialic acid O-acetyltransferase NeuD family)